MAALAIGATDVIPQSGATFERGVALEALAAGELAYKAANGTFGLFDADGASAVVRTARGICVAGGGAGQQVVIQTTGDVALGDVLTAGHVYVGGDSPGAIHPVADLAAGWFTCVVGIAKSATVLALILGHSGVAFEEGEEG